MHCCIPSPTTDSNTSTDMMWVTLNMPSAAEECRKPSVNCQGISHCLESGHPAYYTIPFGQKCTPIFFDLYVGMLNLIFFPWSEVRPGIIARILTLTGDEWHCVVSINIPSPRAPQCSCQVKCLDMRPGELVKLREIANKQTTDWPAVACSNCDVDSAGVTDHPQTTSKPVAMIFCGMPSQSSSLLNVPRYSSRQTLPIFSIFT